MTASLQPRSVSLPAASGEVCNDYQQEEKKISLFCPVPLKKQPVGRASNNKIGPTILGLTAKGVPGSSPLGVKSLVIALPKGSPRLPAISTTRFKSTAKLRALMKIRKNSPVEMIVWDATAVTRYPTTSPR